MLRSNRNGNIRFSGEDVKVGERLLQAGKTINPQEIGFLSMLGLSEVTVCRRPRVAIFSTGDELLEVGEKLKPGMIYDSNGFMLQAQVERSGGIPIQLGIVPDRYESVKACLEKAAEQKVDIIVSSAGVSVGAFDFVRRVVEENGELEFWRVNMRPGKPLTFGSYKGIPFFGLPGNPVSALHWIRDFCASCGAKNGWNSVYREACRTGNFRGRYQFRRSGELPARIRADQEWT